MQPQKLKHTFGSCNKHHIAHVKFKINSVNGRMVQHSKLHQLSKSANDVQNLCKMHYARLY
ncbi:hypothetical protein BpHYR1_047774 [Brachionus plicatilis]|uniref:Uncharacterized protein n=1 Tax=Brachionus plicatilis TaxID=10195 RepID=A0A3M7T857_BRAPC|nr:hypothetical protein BpHYR1_047774 [Brachionus plicatilis]